MSVARDVMQTNLVTIPVDSTVADAIGVLMEHDISGAPVVDEQGILVGIISELQFLEAVYTPEIMSHRVEGFITRDVLTVTEEATLAEVTNILVLHRIRRVPVTREGRLAGIITRRDLLRFAMQQSRKQVVTLAGS
jgi:CBS domain-containing protein